MFLRVGRVPSKKCSFWSDDPTIKALQIPLGHQKHHFGAIFIEFGDTKKCQTVSGVELVPKRELAVSAACAKAKNAFKAFETIRKKLLLLKTTKNARYLRSLEIKPHFGAYTEAKRRVARGQVRKKCSPETQKKCKSLGAIRENVYCVESLRFCR